MFCILLRHILDSRFVSRGSAPWPAAGAPQQQGPYQSQTMDGRRAPPPVKPKPSRPQSGYNPATAGPQQADPRGKNHHTSLNCTYTWS